MYEGHGHQTTYLATKGLYRWELQVYSTRVPPKKKCQENVFSQHEVCDSLTTRTKRSLGQMFEPTRCTTYRASSIRLWKAWGGIKGCDVLVHS